MSSVDLCRRPLRWLMSRFPKFATFNRFKKSARDFTQKFKKVAGKIKIGQISLLKF
jgi:hypothetical protein